jgi:hypothetical protein
MAHELGPKDRPELLSLHGELRKLIGCLRQFIDTEDYGFLEKAYTVKEKIKNSMKIEWLSGFEDLDKNLNIMYYSWMEAGGNLGDFVHGRLLDQAVYSIVRANIMATGLEFKMKRMRKG